MYSLTFHVRRSHYVAIVTQPVHRLQIRPIVHNYRGIPYYFSKLHPSPCNSVGMRPRTDRQTRRHTDTHRQTHRRAWPQYISRRLRLTRITVIKTHKVIPSISVIYPRGWKWTICTIQLLTSKCDHKDCTSTVAKWIETLWLHNIEQ